MKHSCWTLLLLSCRNYSRIYSASALARRLLLPVRNCNFPFSKTNEILILQSLVCQSKKLQKLSCLTLSLSRSAHKLIIPHKNHPKINSKFPWFSGAIVVPCGFIGNVFGGWLIRHFSLRCKKMIALALFFNIVSFLGIFVFLIDCPDLDFAGVNRPYLMPNQNNSSKIV